MVAITAVAAVAAEPLSVPNGSFELGAGTQPEAWAWVEPHDSLRAEWTEGVAHQGKRAVRLRIPGERSPGVAWRFNCKTPVPVEAGKDYIASFWLKAACDRPVKLMIDGYHDGKLVKPRMGEARVYVRHGMVLGFGPCDWTRFERGFTVPEGVSSLRLAFTGKLGSDLLIDDVEIRPGELPCRPAGKLVEGHAQNRVEEKLDRGLVAVRRPQGVYVGWRLLRDDPASIAFHLDRKTADGAYLRVSAAPITGTTDLLDAAPQAEKAVGYRLSAVRDGREEELAVCPVETCEPGKAYHAVALQWPDNRPVTAVEKVGIGDLDGDGRYDFVVKHPTGRVLLYDDYTRWNRSPDTYKIDAFTADGRHLWRRELGWGIEHRNWHSPIIVHDLNGDGRAEVVVKVAEGDPRNERGRVVAGGEWVAVWDGLTGKEIARTAWPSRAGFDCYNFASRHQLAVGYLDGRTPCLIVLRGTYGLMKVNAYELAGGQLRPLWKYCNANAPARYWGQGAHFTQCADVDGDGRDEVALGSMVLDDTGVPLWSTGKGHPDGLFIGDIDPAHPGLEMYNYVETRNPTGGMILVDAATGKTLWELQTPTSHVHGGLCADLDPAAPGLECFGVDKKAIDGKEQIVGTWLKTAAGEPLETPTDWGFGKPTIYWDADLQKELIFGQSVRKYDSTVQWPIPAYRFVPVDLLGDWREELLEFTEKGELRVHLSAIPATDRRVCLMQDPIYRRDIAMCAQAYHRSAMLSYCPAARSRSARSSSNDRPELWPLAQDNLSVHRFSTSVKAQEMKALFTNDEALDKAVAWCRQNGITRIYLETFRFGYLVERPLLEKVRDRFRQGGIETCGLVTPTMIGKTSTGWNVVCCYTDSPTQRRAREVFEYTASFFDTVLIDDFWFTDCTCEACSKAMTAQTVTVGTRRYPVEKADWSHYRRELMYRLAEENVVKACKAVNPKVRVIVKFPCWYDSFQSRGYDVQRLSELFDGTWVGTETRDFDGAGRGLPQMSAFFIARWVASAGEGKCAGAWFDPLNTTPATYLEQARLTVLGGAPESLLHSYGYLCMTPDDAGDMDDTVKRLNLKGVGGLGTPHGPQDIEHLRNHLPELFEVAKEVKARKLTGIAAFKPVNSSPDGESNLFGFLGMLGLPLNPCHTFPHDAPAACFASYLRCFPDAAKLINAYTATGRPTLITDGLVRALKGKIAIERPNVVVLPVHGDPKSLLKLTQKELAALRAPFIRALGHEAFEAPKRVGLFLFDDKSWAAVNFNDRPVVVRFNGKNHSIAPRQWLHHWEEN